MKQTLVAPTAPKPGSKAHKQANREIDWWNAMYTFQEQAALDIPDGHKVEARRATLLCIAANENAIPPKEQAKYLAIHYGSIGGEAILKIVSACELLFK